MNLYDAPKELYNHVKKIFFWGLWTSKTHPHTKLTPKRVKTGYNFVAFAQNLFFLLPYVKGHDYESIRSSFDRFGSKLAEICMN